MAATIKDVARTAGVSTATVSAVINESAYVSPTLTARVLEAVRDLDYAPSQLARRLRTGASGLIAVAVADLSNPFYARVVCAAEAAVAAWGFSLVVFNSDEKPEAEKRPPVGSAMVAPPTTAGAQPDIRQLEWKSGMDR